MSSPDKRAAEKIFQRMKARFEAESTPVDLFFGWAEAHKKIENKNRIVWIPGDGDNLGNLTGPKGPGGVDRALATLGELFTIDVHAFDLEQPNDELAQYTMARRLLDAVLRALVLAYGGRWQLAKVMWLAPKNTVRPFGRSVRLVITISSTVTDVPFGDEPLEVMTTAEFDGTAELDVSPDLDSTESY